MNKIIRYKLALLMAAIFLTGCSSVQVQKVSDNQQEKFVLVEHYAEPVKNFESRAIRSKARELCPTGFNILSRNASKAGELGLSHASCASVGSCDYALEWQIECSYKREIPFSIFGRF